MSLTEKQKAEREQALGSSDAPIVAGVSPYKSPLELYYQLRGELPRYSDEETEAQKWGSLLEETIRGVVQDQLRIRTRRIGGRTHRSYPQLTAHADFEFVATGRGPGILEVKTRDRSDHSRWREGIPDDIQLQVAHQLAVLDRSWAKVAVLFGGNKLEIFDIERDKEIEEYLIQLELRFMLRVQKGEPPDHTWTPETVGILKKLYPVDSGKTIELPLDRLNEVEGFLKAKENLEHYEAVKSACEGTLKSAMQDASIATLPGYAITWKSTKARQDFDEDRFKAEHPDLYAQYQKTVPGHRRFLVKPSKELTT